VQQPGSANKEIKHLNNPHVCIDILLRLLIIHQPRSAQARASPAIQSRLLLTLATLLTLPGLSQDFSLSTHVFDALALFTDSITDDVRAHCIRVLRDEHKTADPRLRFVFGYSDIVDGEWLQLVSPFMSEGKRGGVKPTVHPFQLRKWEMMQDATPVAGENDTSLSLGLFGARKAVL